MKIYDLKLTESELGRIIFLLGDDTHLDTSELTKAAGDTEKVFNLRVGADQFKQIVALVCNDKEDGSLLASLLEQHEMQDSYQGS